MAEKPIASKEAQDAFHAAKNPAEKSAAVKKYPELRHVFAQALNIFNNLPAEQDKSTK